MPSIVILDVHYDGPGAVAAAVRAAGWREPTPDLEQTVRIATVEPYVPGAFYRRELPCLEAALATLPAIPEVVVVDGYVYLGPSGEPGLGAHLWDSLGGRAPVVGIAKSPFRGSASAAHSRSRPFQSARSAPEGVERSDMGFAIPVLRGASKAPLYVTARGMPPSEAADRVREMHGRYRLPTLVSRADHLARGLSP